MDNWKIKLSLFLNYFVFAILLNSVGTVILQVQNNYGVSQSSASILEAFKDLTIAAVSGLIVVFSALGGTTGSIITGHIFENYGGESAFYFSLIPLSILIVCLYFFNKIQTKTGGETEIKTISGGH